MPGNTSLSHSDSPSPFRLPNTGFPSQDHWDYKLFVNDTAGPRIMLAAERFQNVSSLYGPGAMICWFCVVASVLVSWTFHPKHSKRDTVTNNLIAALTLPVVAAAHFLHQTFSYSLNDDPRPLTSWYPEAVQFGAAIEAPLTVCEEFAIVSFYLFGKAASRAHWRRAGLTLMVMLACSTVGMLHFGRYPDVAAQEFNFCHDYSSDHAGSLVITAVMMGVALTLTSVMLVIHNTAVSANSPTSSDEVVVGSLERRLPGRLALAWIIEIVGSVSALVTFLVAVVIKYYIGPQAKGYGAWWYTGFRFLPKTGVSISELEQVVAILAGVTTLLFGVYDVITHRWHISGMGERERT
ncbi:hypothetical protein B0H66DRAFT_607227 [Apodospora peruviana]|uniref:Uncharacterized protein n=1 Tax=Apodospora peruviana TaxID=516989 RepID=A0AAE0HW60_9PEZI|nr:hypothetical protein B0H66DRAFT_607227 [Apodospora peruviana]